MERIVLAYSGGLATSAAIPWLAETYAAEVITVTVDLGQGRELEEVRDRALATGALRAHVLDERDAFAREYLVRGLRADATGTGSAATARALSRPLIADKLVQIAGIEDAGIVAHGDTSVVIDATARALDAAIRVVAPAREWGMDAARVLDYAHARHIPLPPEPDAVPACADLPEPATVDVAFERGVPTGINGVAMPMLDLFESLGTIAAAHGVGRARGRDLRDAPAAIVLFAAHDALLMAVCSDEQRQVALTNSRAFAELLATGAWFSPARASLDAAVNTTNECATGSVRLKLFKGGCDILEACPAAGRASSRLKVVNIS
jgi:argininosuccinate synthase